MVCYIHDWCGGTTFIRTSFPFSFMVGHGITIYMPEFFSCIYETKKMQWSGFNGKYCPPHLLRQNLSLELHFRGLTVRFECVNCAFKYLQLLLAGFYRKPGQHSWYLLIHLGVFKGAECDGVHWLQTLACFQIGLLSQYWFFFFHYVVNNIAKIKKGCLVTLCVCKQDFITAPALSET